MAVGVNTEALVIKNLAVRALAPTDKEDKIVLGSKLRDVWHAVGNRAADGIEALKRGRRRNMGLNVIDNPVELIERLGGLGIQVDIAGKIEFCNLIAAFDNNGVAMGLTYEAENLSMTFLTEDDDLGWRLPLGFAASLVEEITRNGIGVVLLLYTFLELEHNRTSGIYNLDVVAAGQGVSLGGLAMSTQQNFGIMKLSHFIVIDGDKPHLAEAIALHTVVNDIAEAIELLALGKLFFGFLDCRGYPKTETTAIVYFNLYHFFNNVKYSSNKSWAATNEVF